MSEQVLPVSEVARRVRLDGRRILVTGAAGGIGSATAMLIAQLGGEPILLDRILPARTAAEVGKVGAKTKSIEVDLKDLIATEAAISEVGPLDGHVGAAAISPLDNWLSREWLAEYDEVVAANLRGAVVAARASFKAMQGGRGGSIVLVGSLAGQTGGIAAGAHYAASKGGLHAFGRWLARQGAPSGIRVNVVAPASIDTPMMHNRPFDVTGVPLGRLGSTDEVAWPIVFLCSDAASYITGAVLNVNGGAFIG